jgi:hypothetical protein
LLKRKKPVPLDIISVTRTRPNLKSGTINSVDGGHESGGANNTVAKENHYFDKEEVSEVK